MAATAPIERDWNATGRDRIHGVSPRRELAGWYASADALVFPSRTDTYGLVVLEALACGTPVAAFPVTGTADVVRAGETGGLDDDLARAAERCLMLPRTACVAFARTHDWAAVVGEFIT